MESRREPTVYRIDEKKKRKFTGWCVLFYSKRMTLGLVNIFQIYVVVEYKKFFTSGV